MYDLAGKQCASDLLLGDVAVLVDVAPAVDARTVVAIGPNDPHVARAVHKTSALPPGAVLPAGDALSPRGSDARLVLRTASTGGRGVLAKHLIAALAVTAREWQPDLAASLARCWCPSFVADPNTARIAQILDVQRPA
jgi:hypothetical protein